jgi:hypothetical protein
MCGVAFRPILVGMKASYAVTWCNSDGRQATGRLELGTDGIALDGTADGETVHDEIPYRELASVDVGRGSKDRIGGRNSLVLGLTGRAPIRVAGVAEGWIVSELAERLASLHVSRPAGLSRLAVVVPIRAGSREQVRTTACARRSRGRRGPRSR